MSRVKTGQAQAALEQVMSEQLTAAAGSNRLLSRTEQRGLEPFLQRAANEVRQEKGPGARLDVDAVVARGAADARQVWERHNPPGRGVDSTFLSRSEVRAIAREDPSLGRLTQAAVLRASQAQGGGTAAVTAAVQRFFSAFDFRADPNTGMRALSVPLAGGELIDARAIFPQNRAGVPAGALAGFDFYARAMDADWASVRMQRTRIDGHEVYLVSCTTDGDDAYLEVYDRRGQPLTSARIFAEALVGFDETFGRTRFSPSMVRLDEPVNQEGFSEPAERLAAGQPPADWPGDVQLNQGRLLYNEFHRLGALDLPGLQGSGREALAGAAFEYLFERSLKFRLDPGAGEFQLGPTREGTLRLGGFTHPDGRTFEVADWRDIDNGSFTLYFDRTAEGRLKLAIEQFNN
jgi:hypothetical protein